MPDTPHPPPERSGARLLVVAAAVACIVGLGAVVALASRSRPGGGARRELDLPDAHLELLLWPLVLLGVAMIVVGMIIGRRSPTGVRRDRLTLGRALTMAITFLGLALLAPRLEAVFEALRPGGDDTETSQGDAEGADDGQGRDTERLAPSPLVIALVVAGTAGFVALGVVLRRRSREDDDEAPTLAETLDQVLAAGLDDLRAGDVDPRAAVISAYARMERALAAAGLRRHPDETSREYVERVLGADDDDPGPLDQPAVRALGARYEQARFASGPVGPGDRDEAIAALDAVRAELRRAADARPAGAAPPRAPLAGARPGRRGGAPPAPGGAGG